jgi:hypothetical protein
MSLGLPTPRMVIVATVSPVAESTPKIRGWSWSLCVQ